MTLRASPAMAQAAADRIIGTVQRNLGKRAACENAARCKAKATSDVTRVIAASPLPRAAALGALLAVLTHLTATDGLTGAENAIRAMIGRRG